MRFWNKAFLLALHQGYLATCNQRPRPHLASNPWGYLAVSAQRQRSANS